MSTAAEVLAFPLWTSTNHRINLSVFSDAKRKVATSISGKTVKVVIYDPSTSTYSYTATAVSASLGTAYITLTGSNHTTAGTATLQVRVDDITKNEYTATFKAKL